MDEDTKNMIFAIATTFLIFGGFFGGLLWYVDFMFDETEKERHELIKSHIVLHSPFREVVDVSSSFISGVEGWYFVSILVTTDEYNDHQWIYDFRYDSNTDTLYYYDDIEGIDVI